MVPIRGLTGRPGPRLVATDLDGTLVRDDGSLSARTRAVLAALDERDVPVVFVTGRPLRWARDVFDHVAAHGLAIVSNGGLVWDVEADALHSIHPFTADGVVEVARRIRAAAPAASFAVETPAGIRLEPHFLERYPVPDGSRRAPIEELAGDDVVKILARHEELGPQQFWDLAAAATGTAAVTTWSSTGTLVEISAPGVTKASSLALLCADLGVASEDVVAFGDMPNDLPMLAWAGASYAVANAHPTVLDAAGAVAPANEEDGVARVLTELFDL